MTEDDKWLINYKLTCKFCLEEFEDYQAARGHLKNYHHEAYQKWRADIVL